MKNVSITNSQSATIQPMCGLDMAMADIAAGRINHYSSLSDLISKFK